MFATVPADHGGLQVTTIVDGHIVQLASIMILQVDVRNAQVHPLSLCYLNVPVTVRTRRIVVGVVGGRESSAGACKFITTSYERFKEWI